MFNGAEEFDHSKRDMWDAVKMDRDAFERKVEEINDKHRGGDIDSFSKEVEMMCNSLSMKELAVMFVMTKRSADELLRIVGGSDGLKDRLKQDREELEGMLNDLKKEIGDTLGIKPEDLEDESDDADDGKNGGGSFN